MGVKKSQVTIFLILGIVMVMVVVSLVLVSRYAAKKTSKQETINVKETAFDIQPINNFVNECLAIVSKEGLQKLGNQGGYIFASQGGTLIDYSDSDEGSFFINHENNKVTYNILKPRFGISNYRAQPPGYPWITFPFFPENLNPQPSDPQTFSAHNVFGLNNMPVLNKSFGQHSIQQQLKTYVENNIDSCLDLSIFEDFDITQGEKTVRVDINENDVVFRMDYELLVENLISGEKTTINDFLIRHDIRLGKLHKFVNNLIESDIRDIKYDIASNSGLDSFNINIQKDVFNNDDLITITDQLSTLDNLPYKYSFVRKNRNPAMFYLSPEVIFVPTFEAPGVFTTITDGTILHGQALEALDPDEDVIDLNSPISFSIITTSGKQIPFILDTTSRMDFIIEVTDGNLKDHQIITVERQIP